MRILLLSTYEMGHQPLSLAWPLAALQDAGFTARTWDLSVQDYPEREVGRADLIAISVPMHTALRLGVETARRVRAQNPEAHLCFYGLYAYLNADYLNESGLADSILAGEIEPALVELVRGLSQVETGRTDVRIRRMDFPVPQRSGLPLLEEYARLDMGGDLRLSGYTETTRGCLHKCTHCPVVPVYGGRFFAVPVDVVLEDVRRQAAAGARHITFGDPDFLNGPTHALRVAREIHDAFPDLTFDFTAKVAHLIEHKDLLPELVACGALFTISAFESTSNFVLDMLQKGHTRSDLDRALEICRAAGLGIRPTWVAFTPWTTLADYLDMLRWVGERDLVQDVPAVQFAIRLLVPPNSLLLEAAPAGTFGPLDAENFSHAWRHPDPAMDALHQGVSALVEDACGCSPQETFRKIEDLAHRLAGLNPPDRAAETRVAVPASPRLTEDWFC